MQQKPRRHRGRLRVLLEARGDLEVGGTEAVAEVGARGIPEGKVVARVEARLQMFHLVNHRKQPLPRRHQSQ